MTGALDADVGKFGPVFDLRLASFDDVRAGGHGTIVRLVVDTAATMSAVADDLAPTLGMTPAGDTHIAVPGGGLVLAHCVAGLLLVEWLDAGVAKKVTTHATRCAVLPRLHADLDGVLGLDLLASFRFVFHGPAQRAFLRLP